MNCHPFRRSGVGLIAATLGALVLPGSAGAATAPTPESVQACIHRFDYIPPITDSTGAWRSWGLDSQRALEAVNDRLLRRFPQNKSHDQLREGVVALGGDPVKRQIVVLVDTHLVDLRALERELGQVVRADHRHNTRRPITSVTVLASCFGGPALAAARDGALDYFEKHSTSEWGTGPPLLDSRVPVSLSPQDQAVGRRLADRYGLRLRVAYDFVRAAPA